MPFKSLLRNAETPEICPFYDALVVAALGWQPQTHRQQKRQTRALPRAFSAPQLLRFRDPCLTRNSRPGDADS